jgi:addiction module HigA family antidote
MNTQAVDAETAELATGELMPPLHPGEMLLEEFLKPMGITPYRLAKEIGVPQTRIAAILAGKRAITADTAARFGRFFGTSAQMWLNMQTHYELDVVRRIGIKGLEHIRPWRESAGGAAEEHPIEPEPSDEAEPPARRGILAAA